MFNSVFNQYKNNIKSTSITNGFNGADPTGVPTSTLTSPAVSTSSTLLLQRANNLTPPVNNSSFPVMILPSTSFPSASSSSTSFPSLVPPITSFPSASLSSSTSFPSLVPPNTSFPSASSPSLPSLVPPSTSLPPVSLPSSTSFPSASSPSLMLQSTSFPPVSLPSSTSFSSVSLPSLMPQSTSFPPVSSPSTTSLPSANESSIYAPKNENQFVIDVDGFNNAFKPNFYNENYYYYDLGTSNQEDSIRKLQGEINKMLKELKTTYVRPSKFLLSFVANDIRYFAYCNDDKLLFFAYIYVQKQYKATDMFIEDFLGYRYNIQEKEENVKETEKIPEGVQKSGPFYRDVNVLKKLLTYQLIPNNFNLEEAYVTCVDNNTELRTSPTMDKLFDITDNIEQLKQSFDEGLVHIRDSFPNINSKAATVTSKSINSQTIPFSSFLDQAYSPYIAWFGPVVLHTLLGDLGNADILYGAIINEDRHEMILENYIKQVIAPLKADYYLGIENDSGNYVVRLGHQYVIFVNKKYQNLAQVMAGVCLPSDEIAYYNNAIYASKNFINAVKTRSNVVTIEDIHNGYSRRLLRAANKGFRIVVPVDFAIPRVSILHNEEIVQIFNFSETIIPIYAKEINVTISKKEEYTIANLDMIKLFDVDYIDGYGKYIAPALGKHNYYNWYNWSHITAVDELYQYMILINNE